MLSFFILHRIESFRRKPSELFLLLTSYCSCVLSCGYLIGLPATVTSELTIIARRLAKKNVYMKKLDVVDAFGAATVIASDKTGTLTTNNMTVTDVWVGLKYISGTYSFCFQWRYLNFDGCRNGRNGLSGTSGTRRDFMTHFKGFHKRTNERRVAV